MNFYISSLIEKGKLSQALGYIERIEVLLKEIEESFNVKPNAVDLKGYELLLLSMTSIFKLKSNWKELEKAERKLALQFPENEIYQEMAKRWDKYSSQKTKTKLSYIGIFFFILGAYLINTYYYPVIAFLTKYFGLILILNWLFYKSFWIDLFIKLKKK